MVQSPAAVYADLIVPAKTGGSAGPRKTRRWNFRDAQSAFPLPLEPGAQLRHPRIAARIAQRKNAVCAGRLVIRVVEDVEEVHADPKDYSLVEIEEFLRGCILAPRPRSNYELIPPRVQVVVESPPAGPSRCSAASRRCWYPRTGRRSFRPERSPEAPSGPTESAAQPPACSSTERP